MYVNVVIMMAIMSGVAVAVAEDLGGLGGIDDNMLNSITNDMIAFDDVTSTTTTTTMNDNTNYERSLASDSFPCLLLTTALECENTECCTWNDSTSYGACFDSLDNGCPILFCRTYYAESDCENAGCCTWSSSSSMCSGIYDDGCSPFLDDIDTTDDNIINDFTSSPAYNEMTLTPTSHSIYYSALCWTINTQSECESSECCNWFEREEEADCEVGCSYETDNLAEFKTATQAECWSKLSLYPAAAAVTHFNSPSWAMNCFIRANTLNPTLNALATSPSIPCRGIYEGLEYGDEYCYDEYGSSYPKLEDNPPSMNDDDDDDFKIILGSVIGGVCVIIMLGVCLIPMQRKKKKKRDSEQYLNTTAYGGLDFTTNNNCPTTNQTTRFDFEASVAARANTVASFNNGTLTSMTQVPTTTTTADATVTTDNNHLKEGRVKGTATAATTAAATEVVSNTATVTTTAVATAVVTEITTPTNVHGTETVAVAVAVPVKTGITN